MQIELGKKTTIFIGRNGMGKTNLLTAIKQSLSFIFSKQANTIQYEFIASSDQKVKSFSAIDPSYVNGNYIYPIAIKSTMIMENGQSLEWELRRQSVDRGINESYSTKSTDFWMNYPDFKGLPVIAFSLIPIPILRLQLGKKCKNC